MRQSGWAAFVVLAVAVAGFAAGRAGEAQAQSVDNKTTRWLAGSVGIATGQEAFFLFDSQTQRLAVYTVTGKKLEVLAVREVTYDFRPVMWGKQEPSVQDMKDAWERAEREKDAPKPPPEPK